MHNAVWRQDLLPPQGQRLGSDLVAVGTPGFDAEYAAVSGARSRPPQYSEANALVAYDGKCHFASIERGARQRAAALNQTFTLPPGWARAAFDRQNGLCAVSGLPMAKDRRTRAPLAPSIDRIDNRIGYTVENCRLVCYLVNLARSDFTDKEFIDMCRAVVEREEFKRLSAKFAPLPPLMTLTALGVINHMRDSLFG